MTAIKAFFATLPLAPETRQLVDDYGHTILGHVDHVPGFPAISFEQARMLETQILWIDRRAVSTYFKNMNEQNKRVFIDPEFIDGGWVEDVAVHGRNLVPMYVAGQKQVEPTEDFSDATVQILLVPAFGGDSSPLSVVTTSRQMDVSSEKIVEQFSEAVGMSEVERLRDDEGGFRIPRPDGYQYLFRITEFVGKRKLQKVLGSDLKKLANNQANLLATTVTTVEKITAQEIQEFDVYNRCGLLAALFNRELQLQAAFEKINKIDS
ncbi:MAG: hypothetical protein U0520_00775 [Candidatus Saccharimonadales bacterium]